MPRNVPDNVLQMVAKNGGVVMVTFVPGFISQAVADFDAKPEAERKGMTAPTATLSQVADHIDHIRKVAGIDHIGLGGDFDGITQVVAGLEDVSKYPDLTAELLEARLQGRRHQEDPRPERAARDAPGGESGGGSSEDPPAINRDDRAARRNSKSRT